MSGCCAFRQVMRFKKNYLINANIAKVTTSTKFKEEPTVVVTNVSSKRFEVFNTGYQEEKRAAYYQQPGNIRNERTSEVHITGNDIPLSTNLIKAVISHQTRNPYQKFNKSFYTTILQNYLLSNKVLLSPSRRLIHDLSDDLSFEKVTLSEIKRFLRKNEIPFEDGHTCLRIECFVCKRERKKKLLPWDIGKIYVNKTTGHFVCISCQTTGSWKNLQDLLLMAKSGQSFSKISLNFLRPEAISATLEDQLNDLQTNSEEISALSNSQWEEIAQRLEIQDLKKSTLELYEVRFNPVKYEIYAPIYSIEKKRIGYRVFSLSQADGQLQENSVPNNCDELFGWKPIIQSSQSLKNRDIILVKSALDAFCVASTSPYFPLCLPLQCNHLPQELLPRLEHFDQLVLWLGNDLQSWEAAKTFGRKLGEKRCRLVRPQEEHPSPFVALQRKLSPVQILNSAQPMEHKAITTFAKLREEVFSELNQHEQVAGIKWKRYPYLNKLLKGHRRGELTVVTGPTGSGKTTFMSEYSLDLCMQGVNTLWGSFEIRNVRLAKTMLTQFAEKNLENNLNEYEHWADKFEKLPLYFMTFHGQQSVKAVLDAMTHAAYVYDIAHVVVDNLQFMLGVSENTGGHLDRFWKQDMIVAAFRKFATLNNCHVSLVMHPRKEQNDVELTNSSIFGGAKASQEADNVLILQDRRLSSPRGRKYLQLTKNRFSGDLGMFPLEFDRECLSFAIRKKIRSTGSSSAGQASLNDSQQQNPPVLHDKDTSISTE